jgi:poly(A) polymerase
VLRPVLPEIDEAGVAKLERVARRETAAAVPADPLRRLSALIPPDPLLAGEIAARLRLSNARRRRLEAAAVPLPPGQDVRRLRADAEEAVVIDRLLLGPDGPEIAAAGVAALAGWSPPRFPLKGGSLIALGLPPGPVVAEMLGRLRQEWVDAGFPPEPWATERARRAVAQAVAQGNRA